MRAVLMHGFSKTIGAVVHTDGPRLHPEDLQRTITRESNGVPQCRAGSFNISLLTPSGSARRSGYLKWHLPEILSYQGLQPLT